MIKVAYNMDWQAHWVAVILPDDLYPAFAEKMEALCKKGKNTGIGTVACEDTKENLALVAGIITDYLAGLPNEDQHL